MKYLKLILPLAITAAALIFIVAAISNRKEPTVSRTPAVAAGIAYLEAQEKKSPDTIDTKLNEIRQKKLEAQRDAIIDELTSGGKDIWSMFEDYVILGDSRAVGFWYYDFLEKDRVLADGGHTIRNIEPYLPEIRALNPSYIFLCYGLNDVSIGYWTSPEEYTTEFMEIIALLQNEIPGAKIVVSSILPARDPAFDLASAWRNIPEYSAAVGAACSEAGILFVDNDQTAADHPELWDPDGIHVRREFYDYWARNLIFAILEDSDE